MSKTIFITGTSSGFGKLMTSTFLKNGYRVIATMRDPKGRNKAAAEELHSYEGASDKLEVIELDVTDNDSVLNAVNLAKNKFDAIDVLINNAGYGTGGLTEGFTDEQIENIFNVNVFGIHRVTRAVLPIMRKQRSGLIINISSLMGRIVIPFSALYTASKYAVEGYSESLHYELKPVGIDVSIIEPGGYGTSFFSNMSQPQDEARIKEYGEYAHTPDEMWGGVGAHLQGENAPNPQDVADAALDLVQQQQGVRKMRIVVDAMGGAGTDDINSKTDEKQKELLENFGMAQMI